VLPDQPKKLTKDIHGPDVPGDMNQMTFPCVFVDDGQHLQSATSYSAVVNKVPTPYMSSMRRFGRKPRRNATATLAGLAAGQAQAEFATNPLHLSLADRPTIVFQ
jgi:hypothetical protein